MYTLELANCEQILLDEIADKAMRQKDVAQSYALAILSSEKPDWIVVNRAIIGRWSHSGLQRIKRMAWSGKCFDD